MMQKSLLISAALHIFVFLGFWDISKPTTKPMLRTPITVDLVDKPGPTKDGGLNPKKTNSPKANNKGLKGPRNLSLSDLAPKWDLSIPKKGKDSGESSSENASQNSRGGGSAMDLLNKPELVYSSYYKRIHDKLDYYWQSKIRNEVLKKQAAGEWKYYLSKITRTRVVLDSEGHLKKVIVLSPSGEQELDASALTAFKEASPFPNPPRDLIKNGEVSIDWDFILEIYD